MNVSLTPQLEEWVHAKVETGLYNSSSEVVRDALRLLHQYESERERKLEGLRSELLVGSEQLKSGRKEEFNSDLVEKIKAKGREQLGA